MRADLYANDRREVAKLAHKKALRVRTEHGLRVDDPVRIYELADQCGIEVRFVDIPTLEGAYLPMNRPTILIGAGRPRGRQAYTCAHEIGHHEFGHRTSFDELDANKASARKSAEEYAADMFAAFLLMPKRAVLRAFGHRAPEQCHAEDVYSAAEWLGVGYEALVNQLHFTLKLISNSHYRELIEVRPSNLFRELKNRFSATHVIPINSGWTCTCVDAQVRDLLVVAGDATVRAECAEVVRSANGQTLIAATKPGTGIVELSGSQMVLRVSQRNFIGRSVYRHLEE